MRQARIEVMQAVPGLGYWYWRMRAANGQLVCDGGVPYSTRSNARRAARRVCAMFKATPEIVAA